MVRRDVWRKWGTGALLVLGVVAIISGLAFLYEAYFRHPRLTYLPADDAWKEHLTTLRDRLQAAEAEPVPSSQSAQIWVDVGGAVQKPGLYALPEKSRLAAAIAVAGGWREDADAIYVQQNANLARVLSDQDKVYVPREGEALVAQNNESGEGVGVGTGVVTAYDADALSALSDEQIDAISGVGESRLQAIRDNISIAKSWEELAKLAKLPSSVMEELMSLVSESGY